MAITIFTLIVLLFSTMIHEIAHGSTAFYLGDSTAKEEGRLTLNPIKHLDLFGSIILPLFLLLATAGRGPIFGWAKPVPVNPYNLRDRKWGQLKVAAAGPLANFSIAIIFALLVRFLNLPDSFSILFTLVSIYNFMWGIFNLVPLPPLDGSWILFALLPDSFSEIKIFLQQYGMFILIAIIFFGLSWIFQASAILFSLVSGQSFRV